MHLMPKKGKKKDPKFERFIVLADAEHDKVESLLGNALNSNKIIYADKKPVNDLFTASED